VAVLTTTVSTEVDVNQVEAFEYIATIDLPSIFTGYGPLPAVTGTRDQVGDWDAAGQTRTVQLSDGSTAQEALDEYEHPRHFSYTLGSFSSFLRFITISANGAWWFESKTSGKTHIKWRYAFRSRSIFAVPVLWFISSFLWRDYMVKALSLAKQQLEDNAA
jgi:hypothetical protein